MKYLLLFLFFSFSTLLFAETPPEIIKNTQKLIERKTFSWKTAATDPLSKTVKADFAKNGWRIIFQRPLESQRNGNFSNIVKTGDPRNTAELIFIPGNHNIKAIRSQLTWLNEPGELRTIPVYLGKKWQYDIFLRADIATITAVTSLIQPQGGDDLYKYYAEALNMHDFNETTRRAAAQLLPNGGKKVIPFIKLAIGNAIASEIDTTPHFVALKKIGTPEASAIFLAAYRTKIPNVIKAVEEAMLIPPALKGCEQIYFNMLKDRKWIDRIAIALEELGQKERLLSAIRYLKQEPESFEQFATLVFAEARCLTGKKENEAYLLSEQIRLMLARVGDIPGSPKFISVSDKAKNLDAEKLASDRKRLEPLERKFAQLKDVDSAICSALMLCMFNPTEQTYNSDYIKRVNAEGIRLLKMLPRGRVRAVLRLLRDNVENSKESEFLRKIMIQVGA